MESIDNTKYSKYTTKYNNMWWLISGKPVVCSYGCSRRRLNGWRLRSIF